MHVLINNAGTNFSAPFPEYPADAFAKAPHPLALTLARRPSPEPEPEPEPEPDPKPKPTPNQVSLPLNPLGKIDVGGGVGKGALQAGWSFEHP